MSLQKYIQEAEKLQIEINKNRPISGKNLDKLWLIENTNEEFLYATFYSKLECIERPAEHQIPFFTLVAQACPEIFFRVVNEKGTFQEFIQLRDVKSVSAIANANRELFQRLIRTLDRDCLDLSRICPEVLELIKEEV